MDVLFRWALVDIETTGLHVTRDNIIEIAIIIITNYGVEKSWHSLVNPFISIPQHITEITGITNPMVANAPSFNEIANDVMNLLKGSIFVAHNARFDYSFLKNAFKKEKLAFRSKVLCSIKLIRKLYPSINKYNLEYLINHFGLNCIQQHRALADLKVLNQLIQRTIQDFSIELILSVAREIYQNTSAIPSKLETDITTLPNGPGVYLFYSNKNNLPIYIGKSINLRHRIMSHFHSDHTLSKEFKIGQQVTRVEVIETAGELSALLLESKLIKELMPIYNYRLRRKKRIIGFTLFIKNDYIHIDTCSNPEGLSDTYGSFTSMRAAKQALEEIVSQHKLCNKLCGLEKTSHSCFAYQLHRCKGACLGLESPDLYNSRVQEALKNYKMADWPYEGAIAIKESNPAACISNWLVFDQWRHIKTVSTLDDLGALRACDHLIQDKDSYTILRSFLNHKNYEIEMLNPSCSEGC